LLSWDRAEYRGRRSHFLLHSFEPRHAAYLAVVPFLYRGAELVAAFSPPRNCHFMNESTRMSATKFEATRSYERRLSGCCKDVRPNEEMLGVEENRAKTGSSKNCKANSA
jgi:hypothetical protein